MVVGVPEGRRVPHRPRQWRFDVLGWPRSAVKRRNGVFYLSVKNNENGRAATMAAQTTARPTKIQHQPNENFLNPLGLLYKNIECFDF